VLGGLAGAPNRFAVRSGDVETTPGDIPGKIANYPLAKGDVLISESSGGGGFGDPLDRNLTDIERDLREGYISEDHAANVYGAVVRDRAVDKEATEAQRRKLRTKRLEVRILQQPHLPNCGGLRVCAVSKDVARAAGIATGDVIELLNGKGAPVRCWTLVQGGLKNGVVGLSQNTIGLAGLADKESVQLRALGAPAGAATRVWRERLEAML
jgi:N-methylhydantoinase B